MGKGIKWFYPKQHNQRAINLSAAEALSINQAFMSQVSGHLLFGYDEDLQTIHVQPVDSEGFLLPKSGRVRSQELVQAIISSGVRPPASFIVTEHSPGWIAHLVEQKPRKFSPRRKPKQPSTKDLISLENEEENLCINKDLKRKR